MRDQHDDQQHDDQMQRVSETTGATETSEPGTTDDDTTIRIRRLPPPSPPSPPSPAPSALLPSAPPPVAPTPLRSPPPLWLPVAQQAELPALGGRRGTGARRGKRVRRAVVGMLTLIAVLSAMFLALPDMGRGLMGAGRFAGSLARQETPTPQPTPTATLVPLPDFSMPALCGTPSAAGQADCVQCPFTYDHTQYSRADVQAALNAAADQYQLPRALVYAIAWGESNWHSGFMTCNYDLGVMQLKQGYLATFDNFHEPAAWCPGVQRTLYNPIQSMQENVMLGAKWLAWLRCYYGWMASSGGSRAAPDADTLAWYYQQAGKSLPDTSAAASLCASTAQDPTKPWFKDLGAEATDLWSCPFSAKAGDRTFLDVVIAGYNGGPQALSGAIPNDGYVWYIEGIMTQFAKGQLPA